MARLPLLERLARRRELTFVAAWAAVAVAAWAVVAVAACGGRTPPPGGGTVVVPDAGEPDAEPLPDAPPPDPCAAYQLAVAPALGRIVKAIDGLANAEGLDAVAAAGAELGDVIDREANLLKAMTTGIPDLDAAHAAVVATLPPLATAARAVGEAATHAKEDATPLRTALRNLIHLAGEYKKATEAVKKICP